MATFNSGLMSSVTNALSSSVDSASNQVYGVNTSTVNTEQQNVYGEQDIILIDTTGEGVISGVFPVGHTYAGTTGFLTTRQQIKSLDLLAEGEIEGIVSGEWVPSGTNQEGQIGWTSGNVVALASQNPEAFLRSVYLNETPVVNSNGLYNFQQSEISIANGSPSGILDSTIFTSVAESTPVEKTRVINERLRGPDFSDSDDNPFYYHPKVYRIVNENVTSVKVNIKIPTLTYTKVSEKLDNGQDRWPLDELGEVRGSALTFKFRYRPLYKDALGNVDLGVSRQWQPNGSTLNTTVEGLIRSNYIHDYTINFPSELIKDNLAGWEIEVTRVTLDSIESHIVNQSFVESITEVLSDTLSYPNSAIASMNFNAEYFSSIPDRSFDMRLLKVKVPTGYDPVSRQYSSAEWDGTFQSEKKWTDNPAWIFHDIVTNKRYGVGKFAPDMEIDKWTLYEISKFCDTLVSNGTGDDGAKGLEPRFTCNVLINTREEAFKVLKDLASAFRSIMFYGMGRLQIAMDKPKDAVAQFNNANVVEGNFSYSSTSKSSMATVCLVRYNDKDNFYKPAIEYVENTEAIRKFGVKEKEVTAFACSSRGQALRLGRWILSTELEQTETISFKTGPEAMLLQPGDVVRVTDTNRSDEKYAGRTVDAATSSILLDRVISLDSSTNYSVTLTTPSYFYDQSIVDIDGQNDFASFRRSHIQTFDFTPSDSNITVSTVAISGCSEPSGTKITSSSSMFNAAGKDIVADATWSITKLNEASNNLYRIISTNESAGDLTYGVEALLHSTGKFGYIESGAFYSFIQSPQGYTALPPKASSVTATSTLIAGARSSFQVNLTVKPCAGAADSCDKGTAVGYRIYAKKGTSWASSELVGSTSRPKDEHLFNTIYLSDTTDGQGNPITTYLPQTNGTYIFRVFSINTVGSLSSAFEDASVVVSGNFPVRDIKIHSLRLSTDYTYNQVPETGHMVGSTKFEMVKDYARTVTDKDASFQWDATFLNESSFDLPISYKVSIHQPSDTSALPGTKLVEYETNEQTHTFTFDNNKVLPGGVRRRYDVVVQAVDADGVTSSGFNDGLNFGWDILEVLNPKLTGYYLTPRKSNYTVTAPQQTCDPLYTDQFIDSDGYVHLNILGSMFTDIAGGYAYISKHPFSGSDFNTDGTPKLPSERSNLVFGESENYKTGEYLISETNFEAPEGGVFSRTDAQITFKPGITGEFKPPYYMAIKLYDSFDKAIKDGGSNTTWNSGLLNDDTNPEMQDNGLYLGFARDTTGAAGNLIKIDHQLTSGVVGKYLNDPDQGSPKCNSHTFSARILPEQYWSANQGGFTHWIRMNVNGQWEGQGISHVKVLSQKDVATLYDYKGFYEYACQMTEEFDTVNGEREYYPNDAESHMRCRFRTARLIPLGAFNYINYDTILGSQTGVATQGILYGGDNPNNNWPYSSDHRMRFGGGTNSRNQPVYMITGATLHNEIRNRMLFPAGSFTITALDSALSRAGIAKDYTEMQPLFSTDYEVDDIPSYNERGQLIAGKDRPLRGFRRYRVYFDENNLPQPNDSQGLSSYSVVGLNSWNGEYESWPVDHTISGTLPVGAESTLQNNLLFAKDGFSVFNPSTISFLRQGDLFENIPGVWNHHPAGFGQGFGGLVKTQKYFDIHLGRMIDDSYLNEGFFGVVTTNNYGILDQTARFDPGDGSSAFPQDIHQGVYWNQAYVTKSITDGGDGSGKWTEMY